MVREALRKMVRNLSSPYRLIVLLHYVDDCTPAEIAALLGFELDEVQAVLHAVYRFARAVA